jgi:hypothetical protein
MTSHPEVETDGSVSALPSWRPAASSLEAETERLIDEWSLSFCTEVFFD